MCTGKFLITHVNHNYYNKKGIGSNFWKLNDVNTNFEKCMTIIFSRFTQQNKQD